MTRTTRYLAFAALGLVAVLGVAYWGVASLGSGMCGNKQIAASDSPDRRAKVVVFERDCGATTDFSTQVIILPPGEDLGNRRGNVFVVDSDHGRAAPGPGGGPWVEAQWLSPDSILIRFDAEARIFQQSVVAGRVKVRYVGIRRPAA
jgi:hypothetical protein